jgi:hypothetical protein
MIFILPLLIVLCLYTLDVSYLTDEVEKGAIIAEANPPDDAKDLTDVTVIQSCIFVCGMPCILLIQIGDLATAVKRVYDDNYRDEPCCTLPDCLKQKLSQGKDEKPKAPKKQKKSTIWFRMYRTIVRCLTGSR